MPRPRLGALPMTAAERQARRRAKLRRLGDTLTRAPMPRGLPRPRRWAAAVTALMALQDEYRAWLDRLPESLAGSKTADKLQAITELDLDELLAIEPPPLTPSGPAFNSRSMSGYVTSSPAVRSPITRKMASFCVRFRK